jgi:prepilin-type N-terminal cleavage/methylation domain-containing protein
MRKILQQKNRGFTHTPFKRKGVSLQSGRGFTLVETLVAIAIFTISILGLLIVLTQSITSTSYAKQKIVASYLAQEGIEYIRNLRDTYVLYDATSPQAGWDAFNAKLIAGSCNAGNNCYIDDGDVVYSDQTTPMKDLNLIACTSAQCWNGALLYDALSGKFSTVPNFNTVNTPFIRKITTSQIGVSPSNETKVSSTVSWVQGSGNFSITFSEDLFNWVE